MKIGWWDFGGSKYFLIKDEVMQSGYSEENGRRCCFDQTGVMKKT
ncbi:hypothetical protein [Neobacillus cucumis]|nr:hypothetical protein [Neobacillus cucumis]